MCDALELIKKRRQPKTKRTEFRECLHKMNNNLLKRSTDTAAFQNLDSTAYGVANESNKRLCREKKMSRSLTLSSSPLSNAIYLPQTSCAHNKISRLNNDDENEKELFTFKISHFFFLFSV